MYLSLSPSIYLSLSLYIYIYIYIYIIPRPKARESTVPLSPGGFTPSSSRLRGLSSLFDVYYVLLFLFNKNTIISFSCLFSLYAYYHCSCYFVVSFFCNSLFCFIICRLFLSFLVFLCTYVAYFCSESCPPSSRRTGGLRPISAQRFWISEGSPQATS